MARTIGVVGLGNMGRGMALSLRRAGFPLVVHDLRPEPVAELVAAGARAAASLSELGGQVDTAILMVLDFAQVEAVLFSADGLLATLRPGSTVMVSSTIAPQQVRSLAARLAERGVAYLDAPVSGGRLRAEAGTLTIMAGAEPAVLEAHRPTLAAMAEHVYECGGVGAGQTAKMCHQLMAGVTLMASAECLALAEAVGLDRRLLFDIVTHGAGDCWMLRNRGPRMLERDFEPRSRLDIWLKDLGIILDAADRHHLPLLLATAARQWVTMGVAAGLGAEDDAAVIKVMEGFLRSGEQ